MFFLLENATWGISFPLLLGDERLKLAAFWHLPRFAVAVNFLVSTDDLHKINLAPSLDILHAVTHKANCPSFLDGDYDSHVFEYYIYTARNGFIF